MTTIVVHVREYRPYNAYWYNQPSDSKYRYIGREYNDRYGRFHFPESKWGNPYHLAKKDWNNMPKRLEVIRLYKEEHLPGSGLLDQIHELEDKILGCWCKPLPCHGDVLAELANRLR